MKWPWKRDDPMDVDVLLREASLTSARAGDFRMTVADVFRIKRRGTVATGLVETGAVTIGQQVRIVRDDTELGAVTVTGVEMFRKTVDTASAGENAGLLLAGELAENVQPGDVLAS